MTKTKTISACLVSLGCPRNLVDSEVILGTLKKNNIRIEEDIQKAEVLLINTCAFIQEAKEESIDFILNLAKIKKSSSAKFLIVIGCLVQRYPEELPSLIPEVDLWIKSAEIPRIGNVIKSLTSGEKNVKKPVVSGPGPSSLLSSEASPRQLITPNHYAYVKIAEGCSNRCTYCAISSMKGAFRSRAMLSIYRESKKLVSKGVKEINLIAQDTTSYGTDRKDGADLVKLIGKLCQIESLKWLRLLYTHPARINEELINEIAKQEKVCKYIDIPLQHIDDTILKSMGRKTVKDAIVKLIGQIRSSIPDIVLRTSFIVGFPGETEDHFKHLLDFMSEIEFERLGIFKYSREEGTPAYAFPKQIPESVKEERFNRAMQLQMNIARKVNSRFLGKELTVLAEGISEENGTPFGRSYADAPEVDGIVYIKSSRTITPGKFLEVNITGTMEYDLIGEHEPCQ